MASSSSELPFLSEDGCSLFGGEFRAVWHWGDEWQKVWIYDSRSMPALHLKGKGPPCWRSNCLSDELVDGIADFMAQFSKEYFFHSFPDKFTTDITKCVWQMLTPSWCHLWWMHLSTANASINDDVSAPGQRRVNWTVELMFSVFILPSNLWGYSIHFWIFRNFLKLLESFRKFFFGNSGLNVSEM